MKKIIETIAQALVDQPDHVSVTEIDGLQTSIVELTVAKADIMASRAGLPLPCGPYCALFRPNEKNVPCSKSWSDRERQ
jgi:hypothetical protein